jgi:hypothetical protein
MPIYKIECSRIRELTELCTVEIEAADEDAAVDIVDKMERDGKIDFRDSDDLPEWQDPYFEVMPVDEPASPQPVLEIVK